MRDHGRAFPYNFTSIKSRSSDASYEVENDRYRERSITSRRATTSCIALERCSEIRRDIPHNIYDFTIASAYTYNTCDTRQQAARQASSALDIRAEHKFRFKKSLPRSSEIINTGDRDRYLALTSRWKRRRAAPRRKVFPFNNNHILASRVRFIRSNARSVRRENPLPFYA